MSHSRFNRAPGITAVAVLASFCAVGAQAGPVETIYSAENALYGAGHDIGKADGWIDNTLRSAIRRYQSGIEELQATGNLDPQTLSALGISAEGKGTISNNPVPDREAAMAALGLSSERFETASAKRPVVVATAEPEPQPEPEPEVVSQNAAETQPDTSATAPAVSDTSEQDTPRNEQVSDNPKVVASAPDKPEETAIEEPVATPEVTATEPEPAPEPLPEPEKATQPEEKATVEVAVAEESSASDFQLPEEPTSAGPPEVSEPPEVAESPTPTKTEPTAQSGGSFFSSIFDFLFGWLI